MENAKWVKVASGAYNLVENAATVAMVRNEGNCGWSYTVKAGPNGTVMGVTATMRSSKAAVSRVMKCL